jgi:hypothetical protein
MSADFKYDDKELKEFFEKADRELSPARQEYVVNKTAFEVQAALAELFRSQHKTNKMTGTTNAGQTAQGWQVRGSGQSREVVNIPAAGKKNIASFLEDGTKAHGPVRAKALFIPLKPEAMSKTKRKNGMKLVFGKDFILAKRVKGIKAYKHVHDFLPKAGEMLINNVEELLKNV